MSGWVAPVSGARAHGVWLDLNNRAPWSQRRMRWMPRPVAAGQQDGVGVAQYGFNRPRPVQGVRPREIVVGGIPELENRRAKRLGDPYQRGAFSVCSSAVLGDDDGVGGAGENLGHLVDLLRRRDNGCRRSPGRDFSMTVGHQQLKRCLKQRWTQWDGLGDEAGPTKFMNQIGGGARSLRPLDDDFGIAGRSSVVS